MVGAEVTGRAARRRGRSPASAPSELRYHTHHTHELYGVPFMFPSVRQGPVVARLYTARAYAREAELALYLGFPSADERADLKLAMNRLSSALYLMTVKYVGGKYAGEHLRPGPVKGWKPPKPMKRSHKEDKLAKIYDAEVLPIWSRRFGRLLLRDLALPPKAMVLDVGCGTGYPSLEILGKMDDEGRIIAIDPSSPMLDEARNKAGRLAGKRIFFRSEAATPKLVFADDVYDLVICNAGLHEFDDPERAVREFARVAKPGGRVAVTLPLAGTFDEFFDLFREVLGKLDRQDAIDRLDAHLTQLSAARAGRGVVRGRRARRRRAASGTPSRCLFKSSREFFFAPLIEYGPLAEWKAIAGKGQPMQDVFWHLKAAIDAYYAGRPFAVTVNAGIVRGRKESAPSAGRLILDRESGEAEAEPTGEVELITGDFDIVGEQKKLEELDGVDDDEPEEPIL